MTEQDLKEGSVFIVSKRDLDKAWQQEVELRKRAGELEHQLDAISDLFAPDATHRHECTGESLLDNVRDLLAEVKRLRGEQLKSRLLGICDGFNAGASTELKRSEDELAKAEAEIAKLRTELETAKAAGYELAKSKLLGLMRDISEDYWGAGWMNGTEYALWEIRNDPNRKWGMWQLDEADCAELKRLSELCDGWWIWDDGNKFVTLEQWAELRGKA